MELSIAGKTLVILCVVITSFSIFYYATNSQSSSSSLNGISSRFKQLSFYNSKQCDLSMKESDDWFCESDVDWKRRKMLDRKQHARNHISDARPLFFQNNWEPTIQCEFEQRLGNTGDGGKWTCDMHRFQQTNNKSKLLVYSLGSNGDFSFEKAVKDLIPDSEIHTFDMGVYSCPPSVCTFHQARLGSGNNDGSKSLPMIMKELGHQKQQIHILKIDIEGSEYSFFEELFGASSNPRGEVPYIRQILVELHLSSDKTEESCRRTHKLFELFRLNHYAIFHKEANLYDAQNVFEYALLRLNPAFFAVSV